MSSDEEEHKVDVNIKLPDAPKDFDKQRFAEEFERYEHHAVAESMYAKKQRKIPGSVMKPHSLYVNLVQSNVMQSQQKQVRVLFPYPQYCYRI